MKNFFQIMLFLVFVFCIQLLLQNVVLAAHYVITETSTTAHQTFQNYDETENGGVFYVDTDGKLTISSATFINNKTTKNGGVMYNNDSVIEITDGVIFSFNTAGNAGGAIYNNNSTLNLVSTGKIEFTGNIANNISNAIHDIGGIINLSASENAKIIFNDRITSENNSSILNINQSTTTLNAIEKIVLNEDMQGYTGQVNLYKGTVQIGQYGTWFAGNTYVDNATIDMANFVLQEHNFNTLQINKNLNLFVNTDLANK